jgi:hypothetical protein
MNLSGPSSVQAMRVLSTAHRPPRPPTHRPTPDPKTEGSRHNWPFLDVDEVLGTHKVHSAPAGNRASEWCDSPHGLRDRRTRREIPVDEISHYEIVIERVANALFCVEGIVFVFLVFLSKTCTVKK